MTGYSIAATSKEFDRIRATWTTNVREAMVSPASVLKQTVVSGSKKTKQQRASNTSSETADDESITAKEEEQQQQQRIGDDCDDESSMEGDFMFPSRHHNMEAGDTTSSAPSTTTRRPRSQSFVLPKSHPMMNDNNHNSFGTSGVISFDQSVSGRRIMKCEDNIVVSDDDDNDDNDCASLQQAIPLERAKSHGHTASTSRRRSSLSFRPPGRFPSFDSTKQRARRASFQTSKRTEEQFPLSSKNSTHTSCSSNSTTSNSNRHPLLKMKKDSVSSRSVDSHRKKKKKRKDEHAPETPITPRSTSSKRRSKLRDASTATTATTPSSPPSPPPLPDTYTTGETIRSTPKSTTPKNKKKKSMLSPKQIMEQATTATASKQKSPSAVSPVSKKKKKKKSTNSDKKKRANNDEKDKLDMTPIQQSPKRQLSLDSAKAAYNSKSPPTGVRKSYKKSSSTQKVLDKKSKSESKLITTTAALQKHRHLMSPTPSSTAPTTPSRSSRHERKRLQVESDLQALNVKLSSTVGVAASPGGLSSPSTPSRKSSLKQKRSASNQSRQRLRDAFKRMLGAGDNHKDEEAVESSPRVQHLKKK